MEVEEGEGVVTTGLVVVKVVVLLEAVEVVVLIVDVVAVVVVVEVLVVKDIVGVKEVVISGVLVTGFWMTTFPMEGRLWILFHQGTLVVVVVEESVKSRNEVVVL